MAFAGAVDDDMDAELAYEQEMQAEQARFAAEKQAAVDMEEDEDDVLSAPRRSGRRGNRQIPEEDEQPAAALVPLQRQPLSQAEDDAYEELFGGQEGGGDGDGRGGNWGGYYDAVEAHNQEQEQEQAASSGQPPPRRPGDVLSDAGMSDGNSTGDAPTYNGYEESILRVDGAAQPLLMPRDEVWKCIEALGPREMRPKRAMCVCVPTDFFRRDAEFFRQWQLPKGAESRCRATAAIVSLLFAGMQMGFPSGKHEEKMRQQAQTEEQEGQQSGGGTGRGAGKAKAQPITKVSRYTYAPHDNESDSYPMFQIGIEDIYNDDLTEVILLRVWLFVYDETHSTSALVKRVVQNTHALKTSKQVSGASAASRSKDASAEADRHGKAGFGFQAIRDNFEATVGLQYQTISTVEDWQFNLDLHSGRTSSSRGRPCVADLAAHINCAAGRRQLEGDNKTGCGGKHPMAPEFVFNAKRRAGLEFGAVNLDGSLMDVCEDQINPSTYWRGDGYFNVPNIGIPAFWMCTSVEKRTIFDLQLTRPLQGTVTPGADLMKLFLEQEQRLKNAANGNPDAPIDMRRLVVDQPAMNRIRSLATSRDEHMRQKDSLLRNSVLSYDLMTPATASALSNGDVSFNPDATGDDANYTIKTVSMTKRVAQETDRIYTKVISPWVSRMEKRFSTMAAPLHNEDVPTDDDRWLPYWEARGDFNERLYKVKKDLTQYHLKLLKTCFLSTKDSATLPAGYKAMYQGLEEGVRDHGGSASIAFNGGKTGKGRQMMGKDRQVWGSLQEWLRSVFVDSCKIKGRDRRIMDEIFLHIFEMYANTTFVLVIASEKGKGKSVRAMRMAHILPEGWCSFNSATTQRSGMNGNNSPSNGTTVVCDEMISDLTPSEPNERMEFWKTIVGKRAYEIERTRLVKNADGTESHMTFKIVTDHAETYLICCNMGQCFTAGNEEPTAGKEAMVQRTVCLQARAEADTDSPEDEFKANLKHPEVAPIIADFRLFCSLCGFVRMSMMNIDWLQPDFAFANLVFKEGDRMLVEEYGKPKPEPRRLVKRKENLTTMCVHEAVARVFFFKQTAVAYEAGQPDAHGRGKKFEIGDLWDVLRTLRPTREMIIAAWSHSLEYSIGTSSHGINVMTAICEKLGFLIDYLFKRLPVATSEQLAGPNGDRANSFELESFMTEERQSAAGGSSGSDGVGAKKSSLDAYEDRLRNSRVLRNEFRIKAQDRAQERQPYQAIAQVVGAGKAAKYADALFPTVADASLYYKPNTLLQWATGRRVPKDEITTCRGGTLHFKERENDGGAKVFDFAWLVLYNTGSAERTPTWSGVTREKIKDAHNVTLFDMHTQGVADAMFMLASSENAMLLTEQPRVPWGSMARFAFLDQDGNAPGKQTTKIGLRPVTLPPPKPTPSDPYPKPREMPAHQVDGDQPGSADVRKLTSANHISKTPMHKELDMMHQRCRLPSLQPISSSKIVRAAPLRRSEGAIEVNSMAAYEHVHMLMEAVLRCSKLPGLKGLQEKFKSGGSAPACLKAPNTEALNPGTDPTTVRKLPYSIDLQQMAWSLDLAARFYTPDLQAMVSSVNMAVSRESLGSHVALDSMPELTLRYPGFPTSDREEQEALRLISARPNLTKPKGQAEVDVATASPIMDIDPELLRYETEVAIGGPAEDADIEEHRRSLIGSCFMYGVSGDVYSYNTWADHLSASMVGRGNTDNRTDEHGNFTDPAHTSMLDAEFMFEARLVERRCIAGWEGYKHYELSEPKGTTYAYLEKNPVTSVVSGQKRKIRDNPTMRASSSSRMLNQYAAARGAAGPSGARRGITPRDGDSRS